ncbi:nucleoside-diphosphate-sugar epimerase [Natranaerovirga pectinivora]|uniref:Nucleoside-diphosphate-sugar epimerase n=1 Tax=Natranaerovirga pectinivora TaxID=682400 RepID=A0A4R3MMA0_9FIRM|nr:NAD(P)-dependent oxidoreductase [Natranaerovirga pectinivora]TCT16055.1 nucleoside-diphosphate-sugar epimerase [Natranaerovirga pectinivora]
MKKVVVTGGNGKTGRWVVKEFLEQGYEVINVDVHARPDDLGTPIKVDLTDLGQVFNALTGADAVVHLAAIPRPRGYTSQVVFQNNVMSTYNILEAAAGLGIQKVVIASSESVYGLAYTGPNYVPMDEEHPLSPIDSYALSKILNEKTAEMFNRKTGMQIVSLRIGNVMEPEDYNRFPSFEAQKRKNILWSYIDARDVGSACRLAIEKDGLGAVILNIAADDTSMSVDNKELMNTCYPNVEDLREPIEGFNTLLSNKKAKELLDWQPIHFWRHYVQEQ